MVWYNSRLEPKKDEIKFSFPSTQKGIIMPDYPIDPVTGKIKSLRPVDFVDPPDEPEPPASPLLAPKGFPGHWRKKRSPFQALRRNRGVDGEKIREYRQRARLTQAACVNATGIKGWAQMECIKGRILRPENLTAICQCLDITPEMIANDGFPVPPIEPEPDPLTVAYDRGHGEGYAKGFKDGYTKGTLGR